MKTFVYFIWIGLLIVLCLSACTASTTQSVNPTTPPTQSGSTLDGKALFEERCSICHSVSKSQQLQTAEKWKSIVEDMVGKGAQLNIEEQDAVIQYLAATYGK
jgi:mono/diheme cytochrome c family protein